MLLGRLAQFTDRVGLQSLIRATTRWRGVLCLNYHRIGEGQDSLYDWGLWSANESAFEQHVRFLKSHFDVVLPSDLDDVRRRERGRYVLLTFDDGYRDNYETAFRILKRNGVQATFFITTGFMDAPRLSWWDEIAWMVRTSRESGITPNRWLIAPVQFDEPDREMAVRLLLQAYKSIPAPSTEAYLDFLAEATGSGRNGLLDGRGVWMSWPMVREMRACGMVIGGHTVTHPILTKLSPERQWEEISQCSIRLQEELGTPMRYFSYPDGGLNSFDNQAKRCLHRLGVQYAFSYYGGYRRYNDWDDYDVRRIAVESYMTPAWVRGVVTLPLLFGRAS